MVEILVNYVLVFMLFMHCIGDYTLQGDFLSGGKRKSFWYNNSNELTDRFAYIAILCVHSFIWSFCINLPLILFINKSTEIIISIFINFIIHVSVDDLKANKKKIKLFTDQFIHLLQILITYIVIVCI